MGFPLFRVTLSNDTEGSLVISEPGGWDDAKLRLERNADFHSLVEYYDQPLMFYGADSENNGGLEFVRNIEQTQGPDAQITILIEISNDEGDTYEVCVEHTLEIESVKETDFYKAEFGVIRNGFWQNFINRKETPVNLQDVNDLDGQVREVINAVIVQLPSQTVRLTHRTENFKFLNAGSYNIIYTFSSTNNFGVIDLPKSILDEIKTKFNYFVQAQPEIFELFAVEFAGDYEFDIALYVSTSPLLASSDRTANLDVKIRINDGAADTATVTQQGTNGVDGRTLFTYTGTKTLNKGDFIYIYFEYGAVGPINYSIVYQDFVENYIQIDGDTIFPDSEAEGFFIHEAGNAITDRIIGRDGTFYSEYLGNTLTQIQTYADDGCGSEYAVTRGLNVRGYSLTDKPFFMSFDTWWNGINPLLNLGLGYEQSTTSPEVEILRVEPKRYFYNPTTSIDFDFVNNIERSYSPEFIFKAIEIGFEKWSAESLSGIDDPQTKRIYNTRFKTVGQEIKILSKFIGASLAIEQTRRNRAEQGKDWKFDEDVMIIAMNLNGSPEFQPEFDENFTSITNLLNPETRYNIRLSVARNFERWKDFFNGCLQWYAGDDYRFASGEGNFDMTSTLDGADCEGTSPETSVNEKGNIEVTDDFLFMPVVYTFEHPMTWEQYKMIRDNRSNAVGVSRTDENHISCFIMELEYQITHGRATFTVILGENAYL